MTFGAEPQKSKVVAVETMSASVGNVTFTDAAGKSSTLNFYATPFDLSRYDLPPVPPADLFDIRFASNSRVAQIGSGPQQINMQGLVYPLTIQFNGLEGTLTDAGTSGNIIDNHFVSGTKVVVSNPSVNALAINAVGKQLEYSLAQNYPNPFNPETTIRFETAQKGMVSLKVYDILGNLITTLVNEERGAGSYSLKFNGAGFASGVYFLKMDAGNHSFSRKLVLIK